MKMWDFSCSLPPQTPSKASHCRCRSVNHHQHCSRAGTGPSLSGGQGPVQLFCSFPPCVDNTQLTQPSSFSTGTVCAACHGHEAEWSINILNYPRQFYYVPPTLCNRHQIILSTLSTLGISLLCKLSYFFWCMKPCVWFTHRMPNMP